MKYVLYVCMCAYSLNLYCQHPEEFLAQTLGEKWLIENKINRVKVYERWPNQKGEIRKRKKLRYEYTDSLSYVYPDQDIKIYENDSLKVRCFKTKELPEFCHTEKIENGRVVKTTNNFSSSYMTYNPNGQLMKVWYDHIPSIEGNHDGITRFFHNERGRLEIEIAITFSGDRSGDHSDDYEEFQVNNILKSTLEYNEEGRLKKVLISKGFDLENLSNYRILRYDYTEIGLPLSTTYSDIINNDEVIDNQIVYEYIYK